MRAPCHGRTINGRVRGRNRAPRAAGAALTRAHRRFVVGRWGRAQGQGQAAGLRRALPSMVPRAQPASIRGRGCERTSSRGALQSRVAWKPRLWGAARARRERRRNGTAGVICSSERQRSLSERRKAGPPASCAPSPPRPGARSPDASRGAPSRAAPPGRMLRLRSLPHGGAADAAAASLARPRDGRWAQPPMRGGMPCRRRHTVRAKPYARMRVACLAGAERPATRPICISRHSAIDALRSAARSLAPRSPCPATSPACPHSRPRVLDVRSARSRVRSVVATRPSSPAVRLDKHLILTLSCALALHHATNLSSAERRTQSRAAACSPTHLASSPSRPARPISPRTAHDVCGTDWGVSARSWYATNRCAGCGRCHQTCITFGNKLVPAERSEQQQDIA